MSSHWVLVVSTYDHRTSTKCLVCSVFSYLLPPKTHKQTNISYHGKKCLSLQFSLPAAFLHWDFHQKTTLRLPPPQKKESCPWRFTGNDTGSPGDFHLPGAIFFVEVPFFLSQIFLDRILGVCGMRGFMSRWIDSKNCPERDSNPTAPTIEVSECRMKKMVSYWYRLVVV